MAPKLPGWHTSCSCVRTKPNAHTGCSREGNSMACHRPLSPVAFRFCWLKHIQTRLPACGGCLSLLSLSLILSFMFLLICFRLSASKHYYLIPCAYYTVACRRAFPIWICGSCDACCSFVRLAQDGTLTDDGLKAVAMGSDGSSVWAGDVNVGNLAVYSILMVKWKFCIV